MPVGKFPRNAEAVSDVRHLETEAAGGGICTKRELTESSADRITISLRKRVRAEIV